MGNQEKKYIRDVEVAKILGASVQTLRNHRHKKVGIPFSKLGRSVRYNIQDVFDYMDSKKIKTQIA